MTNVKTGTLKQLKPKEGDVLRCIKSPLPWWTVGEEYTVTSDGTLTDNDGDTFGVYRDPQPSVIFQVVTPYRVPIGYTGKLKDMDLHDGDVVRFQWYTHTATNGTIHAAPFDWWELNFTLISRANKQTHSVQWSNWNLSKQDGSFHEITGREYQTEKLGKTKQVAYRSRKIAVKEPVVTKRTNTMYCCRYSAVFETTLIDGVPDFTTTRLVTPKPAS